MAERPILFNTEMVKAILDGRKTQTRRVVNGLPLTEPHATIEDGKLLISDENGDWFPAEKFSKIQNGDMLWVRETWQRLFDYRGWRYEYKADHNDDEPLRLGGMYIAWRPSIHMPREAARLFLMVKDVRIERLQDITDNDALAEGAEGYVSPDGMNVIYPSEEFARIWDSTVQPADLSRCGWAADPWVWVIEFERIGKE